MRRIALVMDGWKRFFTYAWPSGILQRLHETCEEANLYIFNSSGDWSRDIDYNVGEYNIYRLPDLNDFDGIVLDLNNIRYSSVREYIITAAKKTGKPVISVANEIEDFYYVGINNYDAIQKIIAHMHEEHNCRKFWFVMGPDDNYENHMRVSGLKDYMTEHGIAFSEQDFYYDSFEYQCGYEGFQKLYELHGSGMIPDAVICANDNIAVGVCEAAAEKGFRIPADFCVSGFDNFDKAGYYSPNITTVGHIREEVGYLCADILIRLWSGEHADRFNYTKTQCIFQESCGCRTKTNVDHIQHAKDQIMYGIETTNFEEQVLSLEYELLQCSTVREMTKLIPACIPSMKCDAMYLVMDKHLDDYKRQNDSLEFHMVEEELHRTGYPEAMSVEFAYVDGKLLDTAGQTIYSLFSAFDFEKSGTDFLFMPMHFRNRTVGYFVIRNAVYLMEKQYLFQIVNTLTSAMENLHKKEKLEYMNKMLTDLYVRDAMTGLYNHMGYQKLAWELFDTKKKEKENLLIIFVDMDRLKYINDHFGHEQGDEAIRIIAKAILDNCREDSVPVRTGGDEFLIIQNAAEDAGGKDICGRIQKEIAQEAETAQLPYPLTVSIGCVCTDMETDRTLDDYVRQADEIMYAQKMAKKVNRKE